MPDPGLVAVNDDVTGLGAATEFREFREETETFRLTPPYFRTLSAPALDTDPDLPNTAPFKRDGVDGCFCCGVGGPLCTSCTVFASAAVPCIPIRKES